jgi:hypothetical protein
MRARFVCPYLGVDTPKAGLYSVVDLHAFVQYLGRKNLMCSGPRVWTNQSRQLLFPTRSLDILVIDAKERARSSTSEKMTRF